MAAPLGGGSESSFISKFKLKLKISLHSSALKTSWRRHRLGADLTRLVTSLEKMHGADITQQQVLRLVNCMLIEWGLPAMNERR